MALSDIFPDYPEPGLGSVPVGLMTQVTDRTLWVRYDITRTEEENSKSCPVSIRCKGRTITIELAFKNFLHNAHPVSSEKICPIDSYDFEKKIESMAEDLVSRMTRLHKRLDTLHCSGLSRKEIAKIRAWAEQENDKLLHLKEMIREQKLSYIRTISTNDLTRLVNHHPVWKTHCNVYMDQIQKATLTYEEENALVRCTLKPHVVKFLKIFRVAGEGNVLCINSDRGLRYEDRRTGQGDGVRRIPVNNVFYSRRENMFRYVERIRAQWIFTGDTWGLNHILWLDFGTQGK